MGLLPNRSLTPRVEAVVARLGASLKPREAAEVLGLVLGVELSPATHRRRTLSAGTAALAVEEAERERIGRELPEAPVPPERVQISIDATKVPLVGGAWTDVKLAVFADLVPGPAEDGRPTLEAVNLSYVARWEPAEQFGRTLTLEANRRGVDEAGLVVSPNDGADWIQGNLDQVAPQAVRILDEIHAAEHLGTIAGLVYGERTPEAGAWTATQRDRLKTEPPAGVLAELARCQQQGPRPEARPGPDGLTPAQALAREVAYFAKRADQIRYAAFRAAGYPIGSGIVESGHRVVIGARFKGAGQHWAAHHLNPLLVLRTLVCNERWDATWPALWAEQRRAVRAARQAAHQRRRTARQLAPAAASPAPAPVPDTPVPVAELPPLAAPPPAPAPRPKRIVDGRPTADHPWRRPFLSPARRLAG